MRYTYYRYSHYQVLAELTFGELDKEVNRHLKDGYSLHGGPFSHGKYICQAVSMDEVDQDRGETGIAPVRVDVDSED